MADKNFGVKQLNLIGASGTPKIESPNSLVLSATTVGISTNLTIGGQITSNVIVNPPYSVGIGTTNPTSKLTVRDGDISVGVSTAHGVILTSPNGTQYRLIVDDAGSLSTVSV